jgi:hypothetical protein
MKKITEEDVKAYNKSCGPLDKKDIPVLNQLLEKNAELIQKHKEFDSEYDKLSADLQIAYKILAMEKL